MGEIVRPRTMPARQAPSRTGLVAALDVGSGKVACVIGRADGAGLRVLGSALHESQGLRSGAITSLELAEDSIRETVAAAEQLADQRIQDVILSVTCGLPKSITVRAESALGGTLVSDEHLRALLGEGRARCREEGRETIQAMPTGYVVDQARGIRDPRGMFGDRIGVTMHGVTVHPGPLRNLHLAIERCHLCVAGRMFAAHASGLATLTHDETSLGVTLIDMGAGVTSVAVFMEGELVHVDAVPLGGAHVTSDIARMLSAPLGAAERIKTLYGSAFGDLEAGGDLIEVPLMGEEGDDAAQRVQRSMLTRIIQSRMEEIFIEVRDRLRATGFDVAAGRRAVLTGGACQLSGARELAWNVLNKQVRIGRPQPLPGLPASSASPAYSAALGLLIAGASQLVETLDPGADGEDRQRERRGLARWLGGSLFG